MRNFNPTRILRTLSRRSYLTSTEGSTYAKRFNFQFRNAGTYNFTEPDQTKETQTVHDTRDGENANKMFSLTQANWNNIYTPSNILYIAIKIFYILI